MQTKFPALSNLELIDALEVRLPKLSASDTKFGASLISSGIDHEPCPAPLFIGLAWAFALELVGAAMIFGAAYIWWMVTP